MTQQELQAAVAQMVGMRKGKAQQCLNFASMHDDPAVVRSYLDLAEREVRNYHWATAMYENFRDTARMVVANRNQLPAYMAQARK